jgi:hypothetical protein
MTDLERRAAMSGLLATAATASTRGTSPVTTSNANPPAGVTTSGFAHALLAPGPHPSLGRHADTFGRLIGSWAGEYRDRDPGEPVETGSLEVHFGWVLQGRAVQDTWIMPTQETASAGSVRKRQTYGTTVRVFYPESESWRAVWLNPVKSVRTDLIGRRVGDDIVQLCLGADRPEKWIFSRITTRSFLWQAFLLGDDAVTWTLGTEFQLHRIA